MTNKKWAFFYLLVLLLTGIAGGVARTSSARSNVYTTLYETGKITLSDSRGWFGIAADFSGSTLAVGAPFQLSGIQDTGAVEILEERQGCSPGWDTVKRILPPDGASDDEFGLTLVLSGDTLFVGAWLHDDPSLNAGAVYIFERNSGGVDNWGFVKKLTIAQNAGSAHFGNALAVDGDTLVVGAYDYSGIQSNGGSVFIYERNLGGTDNWGLRKQIWSSDLSQSDLFGFSVAIQGDLIVVGAKQANGYDGAAYIFKRDLGGTDNWGQFKRLIPSVTTHSDFGSSVAIDGSTIAVGTPNGSFSGKVYIFEQDNGGPDNWGEVKYFSSSNGYNGDRFGFKLTLNGDLLLVAAEGGQNDVGAVYIYGRNQGGAENWGEYQVLQSSEMEPGAKFGHSVVLDDDRVFIGAYSDDIPPFTNKGSVYVFRPMAANDDFGPEYYSADGEPFTTGNVLDNDNGSNLSVLCIDTSMTSGQVVDNGDGTFYYSPSFQMIGPGRSGIVEDYFAYTIQDENGYTDDALVRIEIESDALTAYIPLVRNCKLLYEDDFSDPTSGWPELDTGSTLFEYLNGEYRILLDNEFSFAGAHFGQGFARYVLSVDVRNVGNRAGSYGLLFGLKPNWSGFYTFEIDNARNYYVWKYDYGWELIDVGTSTAIRPGGQSNTLMVERDYDNIAGEPLNVYANGTLLANLYENTFTGSLLAGVWVTSGIDKGLDVRFDNFTAFPMGCGPTTIPVANLSIPEPLQQGRYPRWISLEEGLERP